MKLIFSVLTLGLLVLAKTTLHRPPDIPRELIGKWELESRIGSLEGTLELKKNGVYSYKISPGYKETGHYLVDRPGELKMVRKQRKGQKDTAVVGYHLTPHKLVLDLPIRADLPPDLLTYSEITWVGKK